MGKVQLNIKEGKASVEGGGNSFLGKLLANHKGKIKYSTPLGKGEFEIAPHGEPAKEKPMKK